MARIIIFSALAGIFSTASYLSYQGVWGEDVQISHSLRSGSYGGYGSGDSVK